MEDQETRVQLPLHELSVFVKDLNSELTKLVGERFPVALPGTKYPDITVHALDFYYVLRCIRDHFRLSRRAFPWEFNTGGVADWSAEEIARMLLDVATLEASGHLPPSERLQPEDYDLEKHNGRHAIRLGILVESFVNALLGHPFAMIYEQRMEKVGHVALSSEGSLKVRIPITSVNQQKWVMEFMEEHGPEKLQLLGVFLCQEFPGQMERNEDISDDAWRAALEEFKRTVLAATIRA